MTTSLDGRKILITGASGFLGSNLLSRLRQNAAEVHAVSRSLKEHRPGGPRWWQADTADVASARDLLTRIRPDVVYHLAGLSTAVPDMKLALPILHSLLTSTVNVLTAAAEIGRCRVVLAASLTEPEPGDAHPTPGSPYAAAKWASSGYARMFHRLYGLPVVLVRPFMTYGPAQESRKIVPYVIQSLLNEEAPKLSSGSQQFDWIYVDDVVDGLLGAGHAESVEGMTIDLGSGVSVSIRDVVTRLARIIGSQVQPEFGALPDRPLEWVRVANTAEALAALGWRPKTPLDRGLAQTVAWWKEQKRGLADAPAVR